MEKSYGVVTGTASVSRHGRAEGGVNLGFVRSRWPSDLDSDPPLRSAVESSGASARSCADATLSGRVDGKRFQESPHSFRESLGFVIPTCENDIMICADNDLNIPRIRRRKAIRFGATNGRKVTG